MTFVLVLIVVALALAGAVAYGASRNKAAFAKQGEVVPGVPSRAPSSWAGAHTPEALMHRRLRAAVEAARAQAGAGSADVQHAVERGALEIDDRLIAAAALPAPHRDAAIAAILPSVIALENAVAGVRATDATTSTVSLPAELDPAVVEVQNRLDAVAEARAEVEQMDLPRTSPPEVR